MTYQEYVSKLRARHGDKFSDVGLAEKFRPYFGQRIEVRTTFASGEDHVRRRWVSGTSGWQPSLMLLSRRTSSGSSDLLNESDELIRVVQSARR